MVARTAEQRQEGLKKAQERLASLKSNSAKATNRQLETAMKSVDYFKRITAPKSAPKPRKPTNVPKDKLFCRRFESGKIWCKDRDKAKSQPLRTNPARDAKVKANREKAVARAQENLAKQTARPKAVRGVATAQERLDRAKARQEGKPAPKAKPAPRVNALEALEKIHEEHKKIILPAKSKSKEDFDARIDAYNKFNREKRNPAEQKAREYVNSLTGDDKAKGVSEFNIISKNIQSAIARFRSAFQKDFGVKLKRQSRRK
jgi:hypothetical protein